MTDLNGNPHKDENGTEWWCTNPFVLEEIPGLLEKLRGLPLNSMTIYASEAIRNCIGTLDMLQKPGKDAVLWDYKAPALRCRECGMSDDRGNVLSGCRGTSSGSHVWEEVHSL